MKKLILLLLLAIFCLNPVFALNFGTYKTESEYGLIDGFKWNLLGRDKGQPLVQLKSETKEEQERLEREKNKPKEEIDEIQMFRFMTQDIVAF